MLFYFCAPEKHQSIFSNFCDSTAFFRWRSIPEKREQDSVCVCVCVCVCVYTESLSR